LTWRWQFFGYFFPSCRVKKILFVHKVSPAAAVKSNAAV
jgi:hypothetical protein